MQIYYKSIEAIHQQTMQLGNEQCIHCKQFHQLVSHGFIYKKRTRAEPEAVGKRVFCSDRYHHTGCGYTIQLYLASIIRCLHYAGACVVAFVLSLMQGMTIAQGYVFATGTQTPRNAYRWLNKLEAQWVVYRSLLHQPLLQDTEAVAYRGPLSRRHLLTSTIETLLPKFGQPLCSLYQQQLQRSFL